MAAEPWAKGCPPLDPLGFPHLCCADLFEAILPRFQQRLRLGFPCGGIDAPGAFLRSMGIDYDIGFFCDVSESLRLPSSEMHGRDLVQHFLLGSKGDITKIPVQDLPIVDGIVYGAPCPPFSSIGTRQFSRDSRSDVFEACHELLSYQGREGLKFWISEMVTGQDVSHPGAEVTYYQDWLARLAEDAPMFLVSSHRLNSLDFGTPQHRERIYTFGVHKAWATTPVPRPPHLPRVSSEDLWRCVLHKAFPTQQERRLTTQQQLNVTWAKIRALRSGTWVNPIVVSADRDPTKNFASMLRLDGHCMTLRTQNELIWLMWLQPDGSCTFSRALHPMERFGLQGFQCKFFGSMNKTEMLAATGNCMTVPVVGAALSAVFRHVSQAARCSPWLSLPLDLSACWRRSEKRNAETQLARDIEFLEARRLALGA